MKTVSITPRGNTFHVTVTHEEEGVWVGVCDGLCLATEAPSLDALMARVWEIAPEMALENGLHIAPDALRLRFSYVDSAPALKAM